MMLDDDVTAVSPPTVYRVLKGAGRIGRAPPPNPRKGKGFHQPSGAHHQWHIDFSYLNICGTFYYLCSILDGNSRFIVHWEIRERMTQEEAQIIVQRGEVSGETPRIISDNGPQFVAKDFKDFLRQVGMTHTLISPGYPQATAKGTLVRDAQVRVHAAQYAAVAGRCPAAGGLVRRAYNHLRLHSAIGYVTPADKLFGGERHPPERDRKLETAREARRQPPTSRGGNRKTCRARPPRRRSRRTRRRARLPPGWTSATCGKALPSSKCLKSWVTSRPCGASARNAAAPAPCMTNRGTLPVLLREPGQERLPMLPPAVSRRRQRPGPLGRRAASSARRSRSSLGRDLSRTLNR
jgi:hypothetical protein